MKQLGLGSFFEKYNGKPALITKSGSVDRGEDYLEVGASSNPARFGSLGALALLPGVYDVGLACGSRLNIWPRAVVSSCESKLPPTLTP